MLVAGHSNGYALVNEGRDCVRLTNAVLVALDDGQPLPVGVPQSLGSLAVANQHA